MIQNATNIHHKEFDRKFGTSEILIDNLDHRAKVLGISIDNIIASIKHQVDWTVDQDLSNPDVFIKELQMKHGFSDAYINSALRTNLDKAIKRKWESPFKKMMID